MEDGLDMFVKNKIDTLDSVPSIQFDENAIWNRIEPNIVSKSGGGLHLFIGLTAVGLGILMYLSFFSNMTSKQPDSIDKDILPLTKDSIIYLEETNYDSIKLPESNRMVDKKRVKKLIITKKPSAKISKAEVEIEEYSGKITPAKKNRIVRENGQANYTRPPDRKAKKKQQKEVTISFSKVGFSIGVNDVISISSHSSLAYGWNLREVNLHRIDRSYAHNLTAVNLEIPLELRYYIGEKKGKFSFYLYSGFVNSFSLKHIDDISRYSLGFESGVGMKYRVFRSKNGKSESFIGIRLPIYNSNLINKSFARPSLLGRQIKK